MKTSKRTEMMRNFKSIAAEADRRGDAVARDQAATSWRELATSAEAAKAPKFLRWIGR